MKILVIALSGIGDALMFTPALSLLRKNMPDSEIDALVMFKGVKDMYGRNDDLDNVHYFDFMNEGAVKSLLYLSKLRGRYDLTINVYPSNRKEYNIISFLTGAPKRAAVKYLREDRKNLGWLNNIRITERDDTHNADTNIKLIGKILNKELTEKPDLKFPLTGQDIKSRDEFFQKNRITETDIIIGMHPGCATLKNHIMRRWEPEKFAGLAERLIKTKNARVLIFGGPEESELKESIAGRINSASAIVVNTKNLAETAAIIERCNLFITNDSSLMHTAAAMKRRVIAIIGPTNPNYIHPWNTAHEIVTLNLECAPCFFYSPKPLICFREDVQFKCVRELSTDMVFSAAENMLKG